MATRSSPEISKDKRNSNCRGVALSFAHSTQQALSAGEANCRLISSKTFLASGQIILSLGLLRQSAVPSTFICAEGQPLIQVKIFHQGIGGFLVLRPDRHQGRKRSGSVPWEMATRNLQQARSVSSRNRLLRADLLQPLRFQGAPGATGQASS